MNIIKLLENKGAVVSFYDPLIESFDLCGKNYNRKEITKGQIETQDCVLVLTKHQAINYELLVRSNKNIIDCRNAYKGSY